ncbi:MAG: hypothetical protein ACLT5P_10060 [Flavonifractor plautii]
MAAPATAHKTAVIGSGRQPDLRRGAPAGYDVTVFDTFRWRRLTMASRSSARRAITGRCPTWRRWGWTSS